MKVYWTSINSPVGPLYLATTEKGVCKVAFDKEEHFQWLERHIEQEPQRKPSQLSTVVKQLREYFDRMRREFDLQLDLRGTPFRLSVWQKLLEIPYGTTTSYGEIARQLGRGPGSSRAVGAAVGANPIPIIVPCHRVLGTDGSLTGFGGGLDAKTTLLDLEGIQTWQQPALTGLC